MDIWVQIVFHVYETCLSDVAQSSLEMGSQACFPHC